MVTEGPKEPAHVFFRDGSCHLANPEDEAQANLLDGPLLPDSPLRILEWAWSLGLRASVSVRVQEDHVVYEFSDADNTWVHRCGEQEAVAFINGFWYGKRQERENVRLREDVRD